MEHYWDVLFWFSCHTNYFRCRLPELTSIADLFGIHPEQLWAGSGDVPCVDFPHLTRSDWDVPTPNRQDILHYAEHGSEGGITVGDDDSVFVIARLPSEKIEKIAETIMNRSILLKGIIEVRLGHTLFVYTSQKNICIQSKNPSISSRYGHMDPHTKQWWILSNRAPL